MKLNFIKIVVPDEPTDHVLYTASASNLLRFDVESADGKHFLAFVSVGARHGEAVHFSGMLLATVPDTAEVGQEACQKWINDMLQQIQEVQD